MDRVVEHVGVDQTITGSTVNHREMDLSDEDVLEMYRLIVLTRRLDERSEQVQRQGKSPFYISCRGQEATQVGAAYAMEPGKDWFFPYYRDFGVLLTIGVTPRELMLALFAKRDDPASGGRQMPAHFAYRRLNVFTQSSPVSTQIPHAAGAAYASRLRGEDAVTYVSFGEGGSSKGDFHEGLNFASIWKCPVVFMCENNRYAISVSQDKQMNIEDVAIRAVGYGIPGVVVDGQDALAVYKVMKEAVERARRGEGPTLIEAKTYRIVPHSSDDDDRLYRSREEVALYRNEQDPINRLRTYILENGLATEEELQTINREAVAQVDEAIDWAEEQPDPIPEEGARYVFAEANVTME
ncbi:MAG: thiamine pyrophosphate-dependent dehydrogenase E1 component subunit alpha [Chloroflexota bacterium]|nr:thiamine pyrophosphate-dependent dehydrogenase E1 component subunit alpha [Chloroflexota bacterium]